MNENKESKAVTVNLGDMAQLASRVDALYSNPFGVPVGGILLLDNTNNPAVMYPGTTWKKIEGLFLLGTSGSEASGSSGGASAVALSETHLPWHGHGGSVTVDANGNHNHQVDNHAHSTAPHNHTGNLCYPYNGGGNINPVGNASGYGTWYSSTAAGAASGGAAPMTNVTGNHGHSARLSISGAGGGNAFSILPPYYKIHIWKRLT